MRIQEWSENCNDTVSAVVVDPQGTEGKQAKGPKPHVELRAARDIESGELLTDEKTISNVTTFILEPIKEDEGTQAKGLKPVLLVQKASNVTTSILAAGILELSYCIGCASLLAVPRKLALRVQKEQVFKRPEYVVPACSGTCRQLRLDLVKGLELHLKLRVNREIKPGDPVLYEKTISDVTPSF